MRWWVHKCSSEKRSLGQVYTGDWVSFFEGQAQQKWGEPPRKNKQLFHFSTGDRVIALQSNRHRILGIARVESVRPAALMLHPERRLDIDIRELKRLHEDFFAIGAFRQGRVATVYAPANDEASLIFTRASINRIPYCQRRWLSLSGLTICHQTPLSGRLS